MPVIINGTTGVTFPNGVTMSDGTSAPVTIAQGGTGANTRQAAMDALAGAVTSGRYLRGDGTDVIMDTLRAADMTGTLAVANGGTGATSLTANNVILGNGTSAVQAVAPGTSGNILTSNGTTWVSSAPGSSFTGFNSQIFTSSGTFTVPTGVTAVKVTVAGGGGGGGSATLNSSFQYGISGGGGGVAIEWLTGLTPGATVAVTVGAGGGVATAGGTSSFGAFCSATGGSGGSSNVTTSGGVSGAGGGSGSGGNLNYSGGNATASEGFPAGCSNWVATSGSAGGCGAFCTPFSVALGGLLGGSGGGGRSVQGSATGQNGIAATGFGNGGSGAVKVGGGGSNTGGAGSAGIVIVEW